MKKIATHILLPVLALLGVTSGTTVAEFPKAAGDARTGTLETMIVENGTVVLELDLNRLNGLAAGSKRETLRFQAAPNSFFPVVVFNDELRGAQLGSMALVPKSAALLPAALNASFNHLVVEKVAEGGQFDLVVRDGKTGSVFFNIEGQTYDYQAATQALQIKGGRLLVSEEFAQSLGRPTEAGQVLGSISIAAKMRLTEVRKIVNGAEVSATMPSVARSGGPDVPTLVPGPDVIVGDLPSMQQFGSSGTQVGLAVGTTSCNAGAVPLNWFAMPNTDHPVIPQNLYRMSGGATNTDRFEQVGQSWLKHAFTALQGNACSLGCSATGGTTLGAGCSDPYSASLNGGQSGLGSRAWVHPFTGNYPSTARTHTSHSENGTAHRVLVEGADLNTTLNAGATYFAEAQYVTPHEYAWCQSHPGQCNMYNNVSYRRFNVSGTSSFSFSPVGATVREKSAIDAWTGASTSMMEPEPGVDGRAFVAWKVSGPVGGMYHYEYAVYNQNLDRSIQAFTVPLGCGVAISNVGFHAPLNHPGVTFDGTTGNAGYSNTPWTPNQAANAISWTTETLAQNPNANAIRWGTMYNFRFDSDRAPQAGNATVGFYKTGAPITVGIQVPARDPCTPLQLTSAVSRKMHGASGPFDIDLPLTGLPGVENRSGGGSGSHTIVVTFSNNVVSGTATVFKGSGAISGNPTFSGNTLTLTLTDIPNMEEVKVMLHEVTDTLAQVYPDTILTMKSLLGDTNGNSSVSASDVAMVKSEASNPVSAQNFRADLTADGAINSSDISAAKSMAGAVLP